MKMKPTKSPEKIDFTFWRRHWLPKKNKHGSLENGCYTFLFYKPCDHDEFKRKLNTFQLFMTAFGWSQDLKLGSNVNTLAITPLSMFQCQWLQAEWRLTNIHVRGHGSSSEAVLVETILNNMLRINVQEEVVSNYKHNLTYVVHKHILLDDMQCTWHIFQIVLRGEARHLLWRFSDASHMYVLHWHPPILQCCKYWRSIKHKKQERTHCAFSAPWSLQSNFKFALKLQELH